VRAASPFLMADEVVEVATVAAVGKVSATKKIAVATFAALLTSGILQVYLSAPRRPVVLTNRRLLLLDANEITGRPKSKLVAALPREGLRAEQQHALLWRIYDLVDGRGVGLLRLSFPLPNRRAGDQIAETLCVLSRQ